MLTDKGLLLRYLKRTVTGNRNRIAKIFEYLF